MCGIIGLFNHEKSTQLVESGLKVIKNRGRDGKGVISTENYSLGHCLHSIVGRVKQPFDNNFVTNCEIYNWKALGEGKNDAEVMYKLIKSEGMNALKKFDGVYAFAYVNDGKLYLARDILGVKPLFYSHSNGFGFASEKKALLSIGIVDVQELNPRKILVYDIESDSIEFLDRPFFEIGHTKESFEEIKLKTKELIKKAIEKRIPQRKFGVLFSGGIDSTVIALTLKEMGCEFTCYTAALDDDNLKEPADLTYAKKVAHDLDLNLKVAKVSLKDVPNYLKTIVPLIEDSNVVKVGVALTFFAAAELAKVDGCKVLFSGLGSEEIFAGYQRHKESHNINKECISGLLKMYERDLYRDDVITMYNQIELRLPLLDKELVSYALTIPSEYKIKDGKEKYVLRVIADEKGLSKEYAWRKKKAAQYGSNFHKALIKLAKKYPTKSEYLRQFYNTPNVKLAALISGGKDSIYAMHVMNKQNYEITCFVTIDSSNLDSYMFHTPTIELVKLQAESMGYPLIVQKTDGEKEVELDDLKSALLQAKEKYGVQGVITGALYSNYQRERIEKVADELALKIFSPLWHINQEVEMREVIREGFEFVLTKVAAEGLDKSWLNRVINDDDVDKLVNLNKKIGLNVAGEGGEFESLVINGPGFSKKIFIEDSSIIDDEGSSTLIVKKAILKKEDALKE